MLPSPHTVLAATLVAGSLLFAGSASADARRIVIEDFIGPGAGSFRASAVRSLRDVDDVALVSRDDFYATQGRLGLGLTRPDDYVIVARELDVAAFVSGNVERGRGFRVTLQVRDGASGQVVGETRFAGRRARSVARAMQRGTWQRLSGSIRTTGAPSVGSEPARMASLENEAPPPPDLSTDDVEAHRTADLDPELFPDAEERAESAAVDEELAGLFDPRFVSRHSPIEAYLGLRGLNRGFRYIDDRDGAMRPYDMPLGPGLAVGGEWYPGAHLTNDALAHIGLTADVEQSLFLSSAGPNGASYPTSESYWALGARARFPLGPSRLSLAAAIARHAFTIEVEHPSDPSPDIASVAYTHGRFGGDARIAMGSLSLTFDAAYLLILDAGEIAEDHWFPGTTAHGAEASVGFIYPLGDQFQLRGSIDARMYLLDFHSNDTDPRVVAGGLDRFIGATMALGWHLPADVRD